MNRYCHTGIIQKHMDEDNNLKDERDIPRQ
jgi:hypothetical protein